MSHITSVDTIRLAAVISVISIHTAPFAYIESGGELYLYLSLTINQLARFAVPFFFVISGYFWGVKVRGGQDQTKTTQTMLRRIFVIYIVWSLFFLLPYDLLRMINDGFLESFSVSYQGFLLLLQSPLELLLQGSKEHLWFLMSLVFAIVICDFFIRKKAFKFLIFLSGALYVCGVLLKAYSLTPIGMVIEFNTRNGPFFGTVFFVVGYFLSGVTPKTNWFYYGWGVFLLGCALHFSEIFYLNKHFGIFLAHDFVFGTFFMGVGMALVALSNHVVLRVRAFGMISKMTVGIYAVHMVFVELLRPLDTVLHNPFWEVGFVGIVLLLSFIVTSILSKFKLTRRISV